MTEENKQEKQESPNKAVIQFMNDMQAKMDALTKKQAELEGDNAKLKDDLKNAKNAKVQTLVNGTTMGRIKNGEIQQGAVELPPPTLIDEPAFKGLDYKHDACPFCNETGTKNIVDQTPQGSRYACRVCAKYWSPWMLNMKYEPELEGVITKQEYELAKFSSSPQGRALAR